MAQESYIGTPPPSGRSDSGRVTVPYAVGFTDSLYTSSQRREPSQSGGDQQYDFTNVFGTRSERGRPTEEEEKQDESRRTSRRKREGSQVRTGDQGSPTRTPGEGSGGTTIQERILAKLSELEAQGKATSVTMAGISSRLDHVESYVGGFGTGGSGDQGSASQAAGGDVSAPGLAQGSNGPSQASHVGGPSPPWVGTPVRQEQAQSGPTPGLFSPPRGGGAGQWYPGGQWDPFGSSAGPVQGSMFPPGLVPPPPPPWYGVGFQQAPQNQLDDGSLRLENL